MEKDKNEKLWKINFLDSAIVTLVASVVFIILSFAFNCGYNNYFGVPLMFTNSNWSGVVYRIPQINEVIFLIFGVSLLVAFVVNFVKISNKSKSPENFSNIQRTILIVIVAILLLSAITIFLAILSSS